MTVVATVPLDELFVVTYGNKFDLNKMAVAHSGAGVAFVGRSGQNNGVSAFVQKLPSVDPFEAGNLTVALGGSKVLSSFVQVREFYSAQNVAVLVPRGEFGFTEKVYYCMCIRHNRFRYSAFGREANRTIGALRVPDVSQVPKWVGEIEEPDLHTIAKPVHDSGEVVLPPVIKWARFRLEELFVFEKGKRLTRAAMTEGVVPFVGASSANNGIRAYVGHEPGHRGGAISVCYNGSVGEAFYQPVPFCASDDVNVLRPRFVMNEWTALFVCALIRREQYRYNYGRKWHLARMKGAEVRIPVDRCGDPDWNLVSRYMRSLQFSSGVVG